MYSLPETLVLDLDRSVNLPENSYHRLDLLKYQEKIRYSASMKAMSELESGIIDTVRQHRIFFLGSGDFHHLSYLLIKNIPYENVHVIVFDNHPDNMFFTSGLHCGSWVYHAGKLPNVARISVFGIASGDTRGVNIVQNRLSAVRSGKVQYYCLSRVGRFMKRAGNNNIREIGLDFESVIQALDHEVGPQNNPIYLSIDKDVLSAHHVRTTWDQGKMSEEELLSCIKILSEKVIAADITGDVSHHIYRSQLKKILTWMDRDSKSKSFTTEDIQRHTALNLKIISILAEKTSNSRDVLREQGGV